MIKNSFTLIFTVLILTSCDAVIQLHYAVKNKSNKSIKIHVPQYPIGKKRNMFSPTVDTVLEIQPNQTVWIRSSMTDIDFPWATKNIYKKHPGVCGLELIKEDTVISLGCTSASWKYRKRWSTLKVK